MVPRLAPARQVNGRPVNTIGRVAAITSAGKHHGAGANPLGRDSPPHHPEIDSISVSEWAIHSWPAHWKPQPATVLSIAIRAVARQPLVHVPLCVPLLVVTVP